MKLKVNYFDNQLEISSNSPYAIEIENKKYFYRLINDLNLFCNDQIFDSITFLDDEFNEINMKAKIFIDYFNLGLDSKKYSNDLIKYIDNNIEEVEMLRLLNEYNKIKKIYKTIFNDIDIPLVFDEDINIENLTKILNIKINLKENLIDNLFLLIDLEKLFMKNSVLIFVNLKQYLSTKEIEEFYKYAVYNEIKLILIDSHCYGVTINNEKKLIIDENLEEIML